LSRAQVMAHEISHASSYQYFREEETSGGRTRISFKRAGLQMAGRGEDDLLEEISGRIDEAVMDELAIRFAKELSLKEPWFLEDIPSADQLADQGGDQISKSNNSLHELKQDESGRFYFQPNSHVKEIRALNNIIQYVLKNKPEVYKTEEEVFDLFAKAALSNNLMPLLRALRSGMGERWLSTVKVAFLR
ncbi:MAG: hypothetical protein WCO09_02480, partial [bacterium]